MSDATQHSPTARVVPYIKGRWNRRGGTEGVYGSGRIQRWTKQRQRVRDTNCRGGIPKLVQ